MLNVCCLVLLATNSGSGVTVSPPASSRVSATHIEYERPGEALRNLAFGQAGPIRKAVPGLVEAFEELAQGSATVALSQFQELRDSANENAARLATLVTAHLLYDAGRFEELIELQTNGDGDPDPIAVRLAMGPPETAEELVRPVSKELVVGVTGSPMVEVDARGHRQLMWVDTGASHTLLARSVAVQMGVILARGSSLEIDTATDHKVQADVGWVPELRVGQVKLRNHRVLVVDDDQVQLTKGDEVVNVEAILGWNALRQLLVMFDQSTGTYSMTLSNGTPTADRNIFWLGYPIVRLESIDGRGLNFGLDTGSRNTSISANIFSKMDFADVRTDSISVGGLGGIQRTEARIVDALELVVAGQSIRITKVQEEVHDDAVFIRLDGVLGSDVARGGKMTIDYPSGRFELLPAKQ